MEDLNMYQYIRSHVTSEQVYQMVRDAMYVLDYEAIQGFTQVFPEQTREIVSDNFDYADIDNYTPLLHVILMDTHDIDCDVANEGSEEEAVLFIVKELIQWGADVNQNERIDKGGNFKYEYDHLDSITPLNMAITQSHLSVVKFLLERGAVVGPLDKGEDYENPRVLNFLGAIHQAADIHNLKEMLKLFLEHEVNIERSRVNMTEHLTAELADAAMKHICDNWRSCESDVLKFLVDKGANANFINSEGDNLLHFMMEKYSEGYSQLVDLLLREGVDPAGPNKKGCTPIILATLRGHEEALQKFLQHKGLLENGIRPMDIGKKLVKQYIETDPYLKNNLDSWLKDEIRNSFSRLFDQGHDDLFDIFFTKDKIEQWGSELSGMMYWFSSLQNYKVAMYLIEKKLNAEDTKSIIRIDKPYSLNAVLDLSSMLEIFAHLIGYPYPALLEKLKVYIPKLNIKLSKDLDALRKNINHEKLSQQFKLLKDVREKFAKLKNEKFDQSKLDHVNDAILVPGFRCKAEVDLKDQFEEGMKLIDKAYNPSHVFTFFTRNEGRDFSEETSEQVQMAEKSGTSSPMEKILSFLSVKDAGHFSVALKNHSDLLNPQVFPQRCKELRDLNQNSGKHPLDSLSNSSDEPSSKKQAFDHNDYQINSGASLPDLEGGLEEEISVVNAPDITGESVEM